jgi:hypothetical protein
MTDWKTIDSAPRKLWIVVNIGCIECGVSSNIVGVFNDVEEANSIAGTLNNKMNWREGGQNSFEVFPMPNPGDILDEYRDAMTPE